METLFSTPPVLKDIAPITSPHDLRFLLNKLGQSQVIELFARMGIVLTGSKEEILDQAAFITAWDYRKTKLLRDMYVSQEASCLTGFLIESPPNFSITEFQSHLRKFVQSNRRKTTNPDDVMGFFEAVPQENGYLRCQYRYNRRRVKSDLSMFRDASIDTRFWIYDTGLHSENDNGIYCVTIQPTTNSDYKVIREGILDILENIPKCNVRVLALKDLSKTSEKFSWYAFRDCAASNTFMTGLLDQPVIEHFEISDVPSIKMFRWDRQIENPGQTETADSESIEEDLDHHFRDLAIDGVSLHNAKTIIAALEEEKHAVSAIGTTFKSSDSNLFFYTELKFKVRSDGLELSLLKTTEEISQEQERPVIEVEKSWDFLWQYWNKLLARYLQAVQQ
ncbi:MAG: hypothetical protein JXI43_05495 [Tissierellales bacterium]|nr:hypothetical protein [Tissierellales bacterium]